MALGSHAKGPIGFAWGVTRGAATEGVTVTAMRMGRMRAVADVGRAMMITRGGGGQKGGFSDDGGGEEQQHCEA
eukprot:8264915-Pyramimonas_sp.AAC.1